jgi:hypothetical protein
MSKPSSPVSSVTEEIQSRLHRLLYEAAQQSSDSSFQQSVNNHLINYIQSRSGWKSIGENGFSYKNGIKVFVDSYRFSNAFENVVNIGKEILRAELEDLIKESANKGDEIRRALKEFESKDWDFAFIRNKVNRE